MQGRPNARRDIPPHLGQRCVDAIVVEVGADDASALLDPDEIDGKVQHPNHHCGGTGRCSAVWGCARQAGEQGAAAAASRSFPGQVEGAIKTAVRWSAHLCHPGCCRSVRCRRRVVGARMSRWPGRLPPSVRRTTMTSGSRGGRVAGHAREQRAMRARGAVRCDRAERGPAATTHREAGRSRQRLDLRRDAAHTAAPRRSKHTCTAARTYCFLAVIFALA